MPQQKIQRISIIKAQWLDRALEVLETDGALPGCVLQYCQSGLQYL